MVPHSRIDRLGNALNSSDHPGECEIGDDAPRIWTATVVRRLGAGGRREECPPFLPEFCGSPK